MEYVDAPSLASDVTKKWSEEHRGQLVCRVFINDDSMTPYSTSQMTSIRHGLRVIQCADISQHDWHAGQILCHLSSSGSQAHAVLIDFSATTQTIDLDVDVSKDDDYGLCVSAIINQKRSGLGTKWVCEYWDRDGMERESWDTGSFGLFEELKDGHEYYWSPRDVDPYKFVYDGLDKVEDTNRTLYFLPYFLLRLLILCPPPHHQKRFLWMYNQLRLRYLALQSLQHFRYSRKTIPT
jgi:hypothetical protein